MNSIITLQEDESLETAEKVKRNHMVSKQAMQLIAKRHRKLEPEQSFEAIANTIGILCAEFVLDAHEIAGAELSSAMRDLINLHINRALAAVDATPEDKKGMI
jgi:hypothetical protein